jgi:16S rRNA A1518/A1519 N6-dimethyltransferase RsmA/KsgA/DIM1 with predicted DNA glycosylase/AP lyase activity
MPARKTERNLNPVSKSGRFIEAGPGKGVWTVRTPDSGKVISVTETSERVLKNNATKYRAVLESLAKR